MHHYFESITNKSGDVLVGYFARVIDPTTQNTVTLAADNNGTPIVTVSGVENMAKSDENGNLSLYVEPGTYNLEIYAPNATSFILRVPNVAMNSGRGPQGEEGEPGPPGEGLEAVMAPNGAALVGFGDRSVDDKLTESPSVTDTRFAGGAIADAIYNFSNDTVTGTNSTAAFDAARMTGIPFIVPPGNYRITASRQCLSGSLMILQSGARIYCEPGAYTSNGQLLSGFLHSQVDNVGIIGAGKGKCGIWTVGASPANGVFFVNSGGAIIARGFDIERKRDSGAAITDDTYQTGISCLNASVSNPRQTRAICDFDDLYVAGFTQYGVQGYGDLTSGSLRRSTISEIGILSDIESRGSAVALTRGICDFTVDDNDFIDCKEYAVLGTSAGLDSNDNAIKKNRIVRCGRGGVSWTEEAPLASVVGKGTRRLAVKDNSFISCGKGDYTTGKAAIRAGTYDGVGFFDTLDVSENFFYDCLDRNELYQSNADPAKALTNLKSFGNQHQISTSAINALVVGAGVIEAQHQNIYNGDTSKYVSDFQTYWADFTLTSGWTNAFGSPFPASGYMLEPTGHVAVRLTVSGGSLGEVAAMLPVGLRPQSAILFGDATNRGYITVDGAIIISTGTGPFIANLRFLPYAK